MDVGMEAQALAGIVIGFLLNATFQNWRTSRSERDQTLEHRAQMRAYMEATEHRLGSIEGVLADAPAFKATTESFVSICEARLARIERKLDCDPT